MICSGSAICCFVDCSFGLSFASKYDRKGSKLRRSIDSACVGRHSTSQALQRPVLPSSCSCVGPSFRFGSPYESGFRDSSGRFGSCNLGLSYGSEHSTIVLLVDPYCSYRTSLEVSLTTAASRFLLVYELQITGLAVAAVLFALMLQARAWELDLMVPSLIACINADLRFPFPLLLLAPGLSVVYYLLSLFGAETPPPVISFMGISLVCYVFANGVVASLAIVSIIFQAASFIQAKVPGVGGSISRPRIGIVVWRLSIGIQFKGD